MYIKIFKAANSSIKNLRKRSTKNTLFLGNALFRQAIVALFFLNVIFTLNCFVADAQDMLSQMYLQTPYQDNSNYLSRSKAFKQEIARLEINVLRAGKSPLPLTQVPRLQKDDVLKIHLVDEQVSGIKPDQSGYDWTLLVAFINPIRNNDTRTSVSREIRFRKTGWYKEYAFQVPYDSQPIFFLYPKPNYRARILDLVDKNQDEIRKIGDKTIELASAYEKIGSFLSELQTVVYRNQYRQMYGNMYGGLGGYGGYYGGGLGSGLGGIDDGLGGSSTSRITATFTMEQIVERLAQNFSIQLPTCWQNNSPYGSSYGGIGGYNPYGMQQDFATRASCVAKNVRLEDLDISISKMIQEGGIFAAAQLAQKYPQLAQWINIAAIAIDMILKISKNAPLKLVPTLVSNNGVQGAMQNISYQQSILNQQGMGSTESSPVQTSFAPTTSAPAVPYDPVKITLYAESLPSDNNYVTAYPIVVNKWQANADPDVISLPVPALAESCLHPGQNLLRSTDLMSDWTGDTFTKDFMLKVSSPSGFYKEFPLRKNVGLGGWEFSLSVQDFEAFPKIDMPLNSVITGRRGFNEIQSPRFDLPVPVTGKWEITAESQRDFTVGGKRTLVLKNSAGSCKCLQAIIFKPSFGGQFIFEANKPENNLQFSDDGREAYIQIDATSFPNGAGKLELRQFNGEIAPLDVTLYPLLPKINSLKVYRGDRRAVITGERLEQLRAVSVNGRSATIEGSGVNNSFISQKSENSATDTTDDTGAAAKNSSATERTIIFDEPSLWRESNTASIDLELEGSRKYQITKKFEFSPSRPMIAANEMKEVDAVATGDFVVPRNSFSQSVLDKLPVFLIEPSEITIIGQNPLTDYDFKLENLSIETRIENSQLAASELPKTSFEVLDWKSLKISFQINEKLQRQLGGKRLQFRVRDSVRGDSDWYTVKQTFVRIPNITAVDCSGAGKARCELKGDNLEYINQISIDGGKTWAVRDAAVLTLHSTSDGKKAISIPAYQNKKMLYIKLRDFPLGEALAVDDYIFNNSGKGKR